MKERKQSVMTLEFWPLVTQLSFVTSIKAFSEYCAVKYLNEMNQRGSRKMGIEDRRCKQLILRVLLSKVRRKGRHLEGNRGLRGFLFKRKEKKSAHQNDQVEREK